MRARNGRSGYQVVLVSAALLTCMMFMSAVYLLAMVDTGAGIAGQSRPSVRGEARVKDLLEELQEGSKMKIAVGITITKDGPYTDGAAVLKHSVELVGSKHDVEMVAIVHPGVQETRPALKKLGIKIFEFDLPLKAEEIESAFLRKEIVKSGCCGEAELLKICAFKLTDYDRVLLLDMDTLVVKNMDHLFEREEEMVFTYDYAMDGPGTAAPPAQGGFLLLRPNIETFEKIIDIVREGDFRPGTGWAGSTIGWCFGGPTVQGVVSYYYNRVEPKKKYLLDHCRYNAMVSTKDCENVAFNTIFSIHYTVCQKPWDCRPSDKPLCREMITKWWEVRRSLERKLGLPETNLNSCSSRSRQYRSIPLL